MCFTFTFGTYVENNLPSKSTALFLTSEMDIVSKNHINDEVKNKFNITIEMHRKQRGKNIFMVYSSILVRKFCLRV